LRRLFAFLQVNVCNGDFSPTEKKRPPLSKEGRPKVFMPDKIDRAVSLHELIHTRN
jgi:hypothetical protein